MGNQCKAGRRKASGRMGTPAPKGRSSNQRIKKAQDRAMESLDYILETVPAPDFVEVVGRMGGGTVTYRVYDDGSMYER